jgi:hypothetical protein
MSVIDRVLYTGNATEHRWSNATLSVPRNYGKIALEEHVGPSIWAKYNVTPPQQLLHHALWHTPPVHRALHAR